MKATPKTEKIHADFLDKQWEMKFYELQKFKKKYRHCDVGKGAKYKSYGRLSEWCNTQRIAKKFRPLKYSPDRLYRLNKLGFHWSLHDKLFERNFRLLKQYQGKNGHCKVSITENRPLFQWCVKQRLSFKRKEAALTKERIQRLTELGFQWHDQKKERFELLWETNFARLEEYQKKHEHCNVNSSKKNALYQHLSDWVRVQRELYKKNSKRLPAERIARLNSIGFDWINRIKHGERQRISDQDMLDELKRLHDLYGKTPTSRYIDKYGKYCVATYHKHFGSIVKAHKAAGINLTIDK